MVIQRDKLGRFKKGVYVGFGFKKGYTPLNKGKKRSPETIKKISDAKKEYYKDRKISKEEKRIRINAGNVARNHVTLISCCCEICGTTENLQRHHPDYNKPKEVIILCKNCHEKVHHRRILMWPIRA